MASCQRRQRNHNPIHDDPSSVFRGFTAAMPAQVRNAVAHVVIGLALRYENSSIPLPVFTFAADSFPPPWLAISRCNGRRPSFSQFRAIFVCVHTQSTTPKHVLIFPDASCWIGRRAPSHRVICQQEFALKRPQHYQTPVKRSMAYIQWRVFVGSDQSSGILCPKVLTLSLGFINITTPVAVSSFQMPVQRNQHCTVPSIFVLCFTR